MSVTPIQPDVHVPATPALRPVLDAAAEPAAPFAAALRAAGDGGSDRERDARMVAEQLVATTFIEPVLTMLRETNQAAGAFAPGPAERRFSPMLDQHLSERIVRGSNFPLVDRIVDRLLRADRAPADDWRQTKGVSR